MNSFKSNPQYMHNRTNQRIHNQLECLGPQEPYGSIKYLDYYWKGEVKGDIQENGFISNAFIELKHENKTMIFESFKSSEKRRYFGISLDLNSLELITFENDKNESFYYFWNNSLGSYELKKLPEGSYSPVPGLNYYGESNILNSENGVYYIRENKIYYRLQSDRYATEYEIQESVPLGARIRSQGFTSDWRFGLRFYDPI